MRIGERFHLPRWGHTQLFLELGPEGILGDPFQAAVGVVDQDDLTGVQELL